MPEPKNEYREYIKRYQRVNAREIEELRARTPEECLRQFFALMDLAKQMDWQSHTPEEIEQVRARWKAQGKRWLKRNQNCRSALCPTCCPGGAPLASKG